MQPLFPRPACSDQPCSLFLKDILLGSLASFAPRRFVPEIPFQIIVRCWIKRNHFVLITKWLSRCKFILKKIAKHFILQCNVKIMNITTICISSIDIFIYNIVKSLKVIVRGYLQTKASRRSLGKICFCWDELEYFVIHFDVSISNVMRG